MGLDIVISKVKTTRFIKDVRQVLGTFVTISIFHPDLNEGTAALKAAFNEVYRIQSLMSVYKPDSEISVLNRKGYYESVSDDTRYVIQRAKYFSELGDGVFDITVLPIVELWEENARKNRIPVDQEIIERLTLVNYKNIIIEGHDIRFKKAGMSLTLAGVAKGYAVDKAIEVLRLRNIKHALVNAGGDIRCIGGKTKSNPWKIAIRDPLHKRRFSTVLELYDRAVATSGAYQRSFNDLINPKSGKPAQNGVLSSSVIADKAIDADILAKFLFIPGVKEGRKLLQGLDKIEAIAITQDEGVVKLN